MSASRPSSPVPLLPALVAAALPQHLSALLIRAVSEHLARTHLHRVDVGDAYRPAAAR